MIISAFTHKIDSQSGVVNCQSIDLSLTVVANNHEDFLRIFI